MLHYTTKQPSEPFDFFFLFWVSVRTFRLGQKWGAFSFSFSFSSVNSYSNIGLYVCSKFEYLVEGELVSGTLMHTPQMSSMRNLLEIMERDQYEAIFGMWTGCRVCIDYFGNANEFFRIYFVENSNFVKILKFLLRSEYVEWNCIWLNKV